MLQESIASSTSLRAFERHFRCDFGNFPASDQPKHQNFSKNNAKAPSFLYKVWTGCGFQLSQATPKTSRTVSVTVYYSIGALADCQHWPDWSENMTDWWMYWRNTNYAADVECSWQGLIRWDLAVVEASKAGRERFISQSSRISTPHSEFIGIDHRSI